MKFQHHWFFTTVMCDVIVQAVQCQSDLCCNILLSYKPDVDIVDKKGRGALHYATLMGWEEGVRLLLRAKADVAIPDSVSCRTHVEIRQSFDTAN